MASFYCECTSPRCKKRITMQAKDYMELAKKGQYIIAEKCTTGPRKNSRLIVDLGCCKIFKSMAKE